MDEKEKILIRRLNFEKKNAHRELINLRPFSKGRAAHVPVNLGCEYFCTKRAIFSF